MIRYLIYSIFFIALGITLLLSAGCGDTIVNPTGPSNVNQFGDSSSQLTKIEFRVSGNADAVKVRYSIPIDGLTQTVTALPYSTTITTVSNNLLLSIEAAPISYPESVRIPFLSVQIFVNGVLFREANSSDFFFNAISASGTYRR